MAFFIPVDLFSPYVDGYELGRKSVHDDRKNEQEYIEAVLANQYSADTLNSRVADKNNEAYDNYLRYQVNERKQPGQLASADLFNITQQDALTIGQREDMRRANMDTHRNNILAARNAARASRSAGYGGGVVAPAAQQVVDQQVVGQQAVPQQASPASAYANLLMGSPATQGTAQAVAPQQAAAPQQTQAAQESLFPALRAEDFIPPPPTPGQAAPTPQDSVPQWENMYQSPTPLSSPGTINAIQSTLDSFGADTGGVGAAQAAINNLYASPDDPNSYGGLFDLTSEELNTLVENRSDDDIMEFAQNGLLPPGQYVFSGDYGEGQPIGIQVDESGGVTPIYAA